MRMLRVTQGAVERERRRYARIVAASPVTMELGGQTPSGIDSRHQPDRHASEDEPQLSCQFRRPHHIGADAQCPQAHLQDSRRAANRKRLHGTRIRRHERKRIAEARRIPVAEGLGNGATEIDNARTTHSVSRDLIAYNEVVWLSRAEFELAILQVSGSGAFLPLLSARSLTAPELNRTQNDGDCRPAKRWPAGLGLEPESRI